MIPIILSGGAGTRLWPLSTAEHPKQYLPLYTTRSMIQDTVDRLQGLYRDDGTAAIERVIVVTGEKNRFITAEQLRNSAEQNDAQTAAPVSILLEPCPKNTAPAIAAAAQYAQTVSTEDDPIVLVLPSDHIIADIRAFHRSLHQAEKAARDGRIVTFGIVPSSPETGYGYIQAQHRAEENSYFIIEGFKEKPDSKTAQQYIEDGTYYWNSGMFMFRTSVFLNELKQHEPQIYHSAVTSAQHAQTDSDFTRLDSISFTASPSNSIDYAVMEKTTLGALIPLQAGWNDIGSWSSLWDISKKDTDGNAAFADTILWKDTIKVQY